MTQHSVPPLHCNINFNAQHSPLGAFMSFTLGHFGTKGGIAVQSGKPGTQDVFIGVKTGDRYSDSTLQCLPFYEGALTGSKVGLDEAAQAFLVEQGVAPKPTGVKPLDVYPIKKIHRHYGWATDCWSTPDFDFEIFTPFGAMPSPTGDFHGTPRGSFFPVLETRYRLLPAVIAEMTIDNSHGKEPKTGVFALNFAESGLRVLDTGLEDAIGFALKNQVGIAARLVENPEYADEGSGTSTNGNLFPFMRWNPYDGIRDKHNPVHLLGSCPGFGFTVPPGRVQKLQIVIGCYLEGNVTTRLEGRYAYTRLYADLLEVLNHGFDFIDQIVDESRSRDNHLLGSGLSRDQQFLVAHGTRSYYGSTQYLNIAGQPYWVVNEGEYCMMNTLDLSVDHVFWELQHHPWVVKNLLDNFTRYYSYNDQVKDPATGHLHPGGISFAHDQGVHNNFAPLGQSSYELPNLPGCFSHMTQEQLCNWVLCASAYYARTGDAAWVKLHAPTLRACLYSMFERDHFDPSLRNGVMGLDSSRCGPLGMEITTYDSLDESLGQARNNLYLAVKCWATYLGLAIMFESLGQTSRVHESFNAAVLCAGTISAQMRPDHFLPAVFEKENHGYGSRILPAIECLIHPLYWSTCKHAGTMPKKWISENGEFAAFLSTLKKHTITLLANPTRGKGGNIFPDGGLKLSSTSNNSWISKNAIVQHVAREVFSLHFDPQIKEIFSAADAAHVKWLTENTSAYWAMSDQFVNGIAIGSKYYPRGVTTALWVR